MEFPRPGIRSDPIRTAGATYTTAVATPDPLTSCARLGIEPTPQCSGDTVSPVAPQWELQLFSTVMQGREYQPRIEGPGKLLVLTVGGSV